MHPAGERARRRQMRHPVNAAKAPQTVGGGRRQSCTRLMEPMQIRARRAILLALAAAALVLGSAVPVAAQAELLQWVDPTLGKIMGRGDYRIQFYSDERVKGQDAR